jgi:hypothetical protein
VHVLYFAYFLLNYSCSLECRSNLRKPIDRLKTPLGISEPYRPMAVVGLALRDRLLRDMREANIWKFVMILHETIFIDPSGSNNKAMSYFFHFLFFLGNIWQHLKRRSRRQWAWVCQGGWCTQVWHAWFMGFHTHMYFPPKSLKCIRCTRSSNQKLNIRMSKNAIYASTLRKLMKPRVWPFFKVQYLLKIWVVPSRHW